MPPNLLLLFLLVVASISASVSLGVKAVRRNCFNYKDGEKKTGWSADKLVALSSVAEFSQGPLAEKKMQACKPTQVKQFTITACGSARCFVHEHPALEKVLFNPFYQRRFSQHHAEDSSPSLLRKPSKEALKAPYIIQEALEICNLHRERDIFDNAASMLGLEAAKLRKHVAVLQKKYLADLEDSLETRALLGEILLITAHRQYMKYTYSGVAPEVIDLSRDYLLSTHQLAALQDFATPKHCSVETWEKLTPKERRKTILSYVTSYPTAAHEILRFLLKTSEYGQRGDFLVAFLEDTRLYTRGGKHFARKFMGRVRHSAIAEAERLRLRKLKKGAATAAPASSSADFWSNSALWRTLIEWINLECGATGNKIKHDIYHYVMGSPNMLNSTLIANMSSYDGFDKDSMELDKQKRIDKKELEKDELLRITRSRRKVIEDFVEHNPSKVWQVIDELLTCSGFNPRICLINSIKRLMKDKNPQVLLQHFRFTGYGGPSEVSSNSPHNSSDV